MKNCTHLTQANENIKPYSSGCLIFPELRKGVAVNPATLSNLAITSCLRVVPIL